MVEESYGIPQAGPFTSFALFGPDRLDLRVSNQGIWWVNRDGLAFRIDCEMGAEYIGNVLTFGARAGRELASARAAAGLYAARPTRRGRFDSVGEGDQHLVSTWSAPLRPRPTTGLRTRLWSKRCAHGWPH
jgi:hypothetical protein